ncbi:MAG: hypothetical protein ABIV51_05820 [Saprospiraceae bacterium]
MSNPFESSSFYAIPTGLHPDINITGENQKGLVVVYRSEKSQKEAKLFLEKIVSAIKMDPDRDAKFIYLPPKHSISLFSMNIEPINQILLFGISPAEIGIHILFETYTNFPVQKSRLFVCHSVDLLAENVELKKGLWTKLQNIFGLS